MVEYSARSPRKCRVTALDDPSSRRTTWRSPGHNFTLFQEVYLERDPAFSALWSVASRASAGDRRTEQLVFVEQRPLTHGTQVGEQTATQIGQHVLDAWGRRRQNDAIDKMRPLELTQGLREHALRYTRDFALELAEAAALGPQ